ncbi:MAG TPA: DUF4886 domain-containing protein [Opitutaceae bacterium]|nr:DUF4886 domain-containing protein [Opitutaceae bacterium]
MYQRLPWVCVLLIQICIIVSSSQAKTLRVFVAGNSFSNNATRYLPDLIKEGGHELIMGKAVTGGCSLERHWKALDADLSSSSDPAGKIYSGKSLRENFGTEKWDVITLQQYSLQSSKPETFEPYASQLVAFFRRERPNAEILVHQTWAYRSDAAKFGLISEGGNATDNKTMWERSRAAYHLMAKTHGLRIIPTGDAFWAVESDSNWSYHVDPDFDFTSPKKPALPQQVHSLHVGYKWDKEGKFGKDANHANVAGEYLGALVWYGMLFDENPENVKFTPPGVDHGFAAHLRLVAQQTLREIKNTNTKNRSSGPNLTSAR